MAKRFYHIAFELGVAPRDFMRELAEAGLSVGNQMIVIPDELESRIREVYRELRPAPEPRSVIEPAAQSEAELTEAPAATAVATAEADTPSATEVGVEAGTATDASVGVEERATEVEPVEAAESGVGTAQAGAPVESAPTETVPAEAAPSKAAPSKAAPSEAVPSEAVPSEAAPSKAVPVEEGAPSVPGSTAIAADAGEQAGDAVAQAKTPAKGGKKGGKAGKKAAKRAEAAAAAAAAAGAAAPGEPATTAAGDTVLPGPDAAGQRRRGRRPGDAPEAIDLVPTIDPRAGRLVKDAPRGGIPGITAPPKERGGMDITNLNPTIPTSDRAPGRARDGHRRSSTPERYRGKRGKETFHMRRRSRKSKREPARPRPTVFDVEPPVSVKKFSELSGYKAAEILKILFKNHGLMVNVNSMLDEDTLELLALELELDLTMIHKETAEDLLTQRAQAEDAPEDLRARPPVVTILGHVDHGKTTLLDKIRASDVAAHEAGGITQHISASQVTLSDGRKVTFLDTPGHEAFTEMRARGAQVTDVVILIVAADDGVMPQTIESISHVKAAGVPMVIAITKSDKANANTTRVRQQLTEHEVFVEGYGGDVSAFDVSGITGDGVPEILEHIALMAEVESERFRANPTRMAEGTVIESENSPRRGVVATVLVQNGTLKRGDPVLAGEAFGTVRAMFDYLGREMKEAGPGDPVEIIGLSTPPEAGSKFFVLEDTNRARGIAETRRQKSREKELAAQSKPTTVESLLGAISEGKIQELNVVLKADVKGSLEPIKGLLGAMGTEEVRVKVIHSAVGAVNDSDVILASASSAWIIGFNVNVDERARERAKMAGVEVRVYRVIYDIEKDVRDALEGKLAPEQREVILGHAEILALFSSSRLGTIAGCRVRDGIMRRDATIRVKRGGEIVHSAGMASLRREKDEVREVKDGFECGIRLEGWDAFKEGDELEAFTMEEVRRTLD